MITFNFFITHCKHASCSNTLQAACAGDLSNFLVLPQLPVDKQKNTFQQQLVLKICTVTNCFVSGLNSDPKYRYRYFPDSVSNSDYTGRSGSR